MTSCNPPNPAGFTAWFRKAHIDAMLERAARCGWRAGRIAGPMDIGDLDHSASTDAQGQPRPGARQAFEAGWWASRHQLERQDAKDSPRSIAAVNVRERKAAAASAKRRSAAEQRKADAYAAKQAESLAKHRAAMDKEEELRRGREMYSAARQQIWAIAEVDEKSGDKKTLDPIEAARRLRGLVNEDVETLGGHVPAVKLYLKERRRVKASIREEAKAVAKTRAERDVKMSTRLAERRSRQAKLHGPAPKLYGGRVVK